MSARLRTKTQELVKAHLEGGATLKQLSEATGLNYVFIHRFKAGKDQSFNCDHVEKLYTYLTGRELNV